MVQRYLEKSVIVNTTGKRDGEDANNVSVGDIGGRTKNFTLYSSYHLKKRRRGMVDKEERTSRIILLDIMANGANGHLAQGCALHNDIDGAENLEYVAVT